MIRLGLRLSLRSGTEALVRLLLTTAAVAIGVTVLLAVAADFHAFQTTIARPCWECTQGVPAAGQSSGPADAELWRFSEDYFQGRAVERVDVAALGPQAPVIVGLPKVPADGEYYVSPALGRLLDTTPHRELADRFPGTRAGLIGDAALSSPDSLVVVAGRTPSALATEPGTQQVDKIATAPEPQSTTALYQFGFGLTTIALTMPLMIFIGTATRLAAARREQRYAAMRLVGATPRQIDVIASVEAAAGALIGTVLGVGAFALAQSTIADISITGTRFFPADVTPTISGYAAVAVGVPAVAVVAALWSLRRVRISPLGVSRRTTPPAPRAWRVLPLLAGVAMFVAGIVLGGDTPSEALVYPSLMLVIVGMVIAGPWLTMVAARSLSRITPGPSSLLAARRLVDNPRAAFRTVSGLTMAVFVGTAIAVLLPGLLVQPNTGGDPALKDVLRVEYGSGPRAHGLPPQQGTDILTALSAYAGATVIPIYRLPEVNQPEPPSGSPMAPVNDSVIECRLLERLPVLGNCAPGVTAVQLIPADLFVDNPEAVHLPIVGAGNPAYTGDVSALRLGALMVKTDSASTLEEVRTYLSTHAAIPAPTEGPQGWLINARYPATFGEIAALRSATYDALQRIGYAAIVLTLLVAACSLAVSTAGAVVERRRPFTLLRLTGTPLSTLTKVVLWESMVPLAAAAGVAAVTGYAMAAAITKTMSSVTALPWPPRQYFVTTGTGLAVSLVVILATLPLLARMTRSDDARFE